METPPTNEPLAANTNEPPSESNPAARTVLNATITEETERLRRDLETERAARRKAEQKCAENEDALHRITQPDPLPVNVKPPKVVSRMFTWGRPTEN